MTLSVDLAAGRATQVLRGVLDACLLAVLDERPAYGYEMTRRLSERGLDIVSDGSIYPVLGRLQRAELVETYLEPGNGTGPPRKYYQLTESGRHALRLWRQSWVATRSAIDAVLDTKEATR